MTVYKFLPDGCFGVFFTAVDDVLLIFFLVLYTVAKYSLQGTTQGRYLTGGVPPVRFSM
jgi:hypothetical protein